MSILLIAEAPAERGLYANTLPPPGILSLAASLRARNIACTVHDAQVMPPLHELPAEVTHVGLSIHAGNVTRSRERLRWLRERYPRVQIIVGGPLPSAEPGWFLGDGEADAVVAGEGEETLAEYLRTDDSACVRGLYLRGTDGTAVCTGARGVLADLDTLPFPAYDLVPLARYRVLLSKRRPLSVLMTSRGCPHTCSFCYQPMGRQWRARSPEHVVREVVWQVRTFGVRELCVFDDNFTCDTERAKEICRQLIAADTGVLLQTTNGLRVDRVDAELLALLRRAGFWKVDFAVESGSAETLRRIGKQINLEQAATAICLAKAAGLYTHAYYMLGFPWETLADMEATIAVARRLDADLNQFSRVVPYPGSALGAELTAAQREALFRQDAGVFSGPPPLLPAGMTAAEYLSVSRRAYRQTMYRPGKLVALLRQLPLRSFFELARYALSTGNV